MYLTIGRNSDTAKLTRKTRFLIDDPESPSVMAYQLTKPLKVGTTFGIGQIKGVYKFVIQEVNTTDDDNLELMIPDYYKHFPRDDTSGQPGGSIQPDPSDTENPTDPADPGNTDPADQEGRGMWL